MPGAVKCLDEKARISVDDEGNVKHGRTTTPYTDSH